MATKLSNLINPEVFADFVDAKLVDNIDRKSVV